MNLRRPWVILLAGVLSASGSGCAVYNAVTSTSHSSSGPNGTAERFVSIGRTFENQSRYDQAEMMYRKALRIRPNDETIQSHLTQLADRRAGRDFGADSIDRAVAMADAVSGRKTSSFLAAEAQAVAVEAALSGIPEQAEKLVPSNSGTASLNSVELENLPTIAQAAGTIAVEQSAVSTSGRMRISEWSEEETDPAGLVLLSESSADETWDDV
ncbi:MAG: hypothetical protein KDA91_16475, partial [Planctomycetaceae bacterium]|nr:hypothetical protein [Planctomycetaceae bacterium]